MNDYGEFADLGVIAQALRDGDFGWIYSKASGLFFDMADLQTLFAVKKSKPYRRWNDSHRDTSGNTG